MPSNLLLNGSKDVTAVVAVSRKVLDFSVAVSTDDMSGFNAAVAVTGTDTAGFAGVLRVIVLVSTPSGSESSGLYGSSVTHTHTYLNYFL